MRWHAALLAAMIGCAAPDPVAPNVATVEPSLGLDEADTDIRITGRNFDPHVFTDFSDGEKSRVDATFRISLLRHDGSGEPVLLEPVTHVSAGALETRVPSGVSRGIYDLEIESPSGQRTVLTDAFQVVRSPRHVAGFRIEPVGPQRIGIPFQLSLTAVDANGGVVDGFTGHVTVEDDTGTLTPAQLGPFVLGRFRGSVSVGAYAAQNVMTVSTSDGATARSEPFQVIPGFVTEAAVVTPARSLTVGDCSDVVEVETRDAMGTPAAPEADLVYGLEAAPAQGLTFFADPQCQQPVDRVRQPAGETRVALYFSGQQAGETALFLLPEVLPSVGQKQTLIPGPAQSLRFTSLAPVLTMGACSSALTVAAEDRFGNATEPATALELTLSATPSGRVSFYSDAACQEPLGMLTMGATVSFHIRGDAVGSAQLRVEAHESSGVTEATQLAQVTP